jgi:hypothetical protein
MTATANFLVHDVKNVVRVPNTYLKVDRAYNQTTVNLINPDGSTALVPVTLGVQGTDYSEVISGLRVGDRILSMGDVAITSDDSFGTFREHYAGTALAALPLAVRRGAQTVTLQLPVRLFSRTFTQVSTIPGASDKAVRIRNGIMKGTTS